MGGKGGDEATKEAQQARADEQARQERIRAGTARVGEIFEGGTASGTGRLAAGTRYNPGAKYYTKGGSFWTPKTGVSPATTTATPGAPTTFSGSQGDPRHGFAPPGTTTTPGTAYASPEQQFIEALKAGQVYGGRTKTQGTFSPEFYGKERQSLIDYATPQLVDQHSEAKRQLIYAMARSGLTDSSASAVKGGELTKLYDTGKRDIVDKANQAVNQTKANVEDARQQLIQTLNVTGDAQGAAQGAIRRATALSQPPSFSPLGQLFTDFTASLGQQSALERASYYSGQPVARYNTGVFTPNRKSVSVT